jgi:hypothetical protein
MCTNLTLAPTGSRMNKQAQVVLVKYLGEILKKNLEARFCFFYPCHRALAAFTPGDLVSLRSLSTRPFALQC